MKKKLLIIFLIILSLFVIINLLLFRTKKVNLKKNDIEIVVPKFSYLYKEKDNEIIFKTLRGKKSIENELKRIERKYISKKCNNRLVYYDEKNNITITNYKIYKKGFFNYFSINFQTGLISNNSCGRILDIKKTDLRFKDCGNVKCYQNSRYKFRTKDNIEYFLYYDLDKDILIKSGMENYNYLDSLLDYRWLYREDLIKFMNYQSSVDKKIKKIKKQDYTIYYNDNFMLVDCKNNDIYITNPTSLDKYFCS